MRALRPLPAPTDRNGRPLPQQRLIGGGTAAAADKAKYATAERNLGDHVCPNDFAAFGAEHFGALCRAPRGRLKTLNVERICIALASA